MIAIGQIQRYALGLRCVLAGMVLMVSARQGLAGGQVKPACVPVAEASRQANKDVCVSAHVYEVVELPDGTRFLDVCPAEVADKDCLFLIVCLPEDRGDVGELRKYRDANIELRGIVRPMQGRMGMVVSHLRQFAGGPEKFKPNPRLVHGFNGQAERPPVADPNLKGSGRHRSFMNPLDKEAVSQTKR
jgi:hypothetical protein